MATMAIRENGQTNRAHKQGALCAVKVIALGHNALYTSPNTKG